MSKLRILCLHGYHGTGEILRRQMGSLVAALEKTADLVYLDAPSRAEGDFGWWHAVEAEHAPRDVKENPGVTGPQRHYRGWSRTHAAILKTVAEAGPFDGAFGFSQGGALTGLIVGLPELALRFAVMVSGFVSNDPELAKLYEAPAKYRIPSLHVIGTADTIVANDHTRALATKFANPTIIEHDGGHIVPEDPRILAFIDSR